MSFVCQSPHDTQQHTQPTDEQSPGENYSDKEQAAVGIRDEEVPDITSTPDGNDLVNSGVVPTGCDATVSQKTTDVQPQNSPTIARDDQLTSQPWAQKEETLSRWLLTETSSSTT